MLCHCKVRFTKQGKMTETNYSLWPNFKIKFEISDFFVTTGRYGRTQNIWWICRPGLSKSPISRHPDRALFLPSDVCAYMFRKPLHILGNFSATCSFHFSSALPRGIPESQQPTRSQIIRICMWLYRKIDKMATVRPEKFKIPSAGIDRGKINWYKTRFAGLPREHFCSFYKEVAGKLQVPIEGILNMWRGY